MRARARARGLGGGTRSSPAWDRQRALAAAGSTAPAHHPPLRPPPHPELSSIQIESHTNMAVSGVPGSGRLRTRTAPAQRGVCVARACPAAAAQAPPGVSACTPAPLAPQEYRRLYNLEPLVKDEAEVQEAERVRATVGGGGGGAGWVGFSGAGRGLRRARRACALRPAA